MLRDAVECQSRSAHFDGVPAATPLPFAFDPLRPDVRDCDRPVCPQVIQPQRILQRLKDKFAIDLPPLFRRSFITRTITTYSAFI